MNVDQLLRYYNGNKTEAAAGIGYTPQSIDNWTRAGEIPHKAQRLIQAATFGKLKAVKPTKR